MSLLIKNSFILICLLFVVTSCEESVVEKFAIEKFPRIVGSWDHEINCYDPCPYSHLSFDAEGNGLYEYFDETISETKTTEGKAAIDDDNHVTINDQGFFTIYEIRDTIGYYVLDESCYCTEYDSVKFTKVMVNSGSLYYNFEY